MIAAGFDRYEGERRPARGLTSLGLDDDLGLEDGIDFSMGTSSTEDESDDEFDVPEFLR